MDRRQMKTRKAIFEAFTELLGKSSYSSITVQDIIDRANIGRSTFYSHFQTKDELMRALCAELFDHVIGTAVDSLHQHCPLLDDSVSKPSVFLHILLHLEKNDNGLLTLLSRDDTGIITGYFKERMDQLVRSDVLPKEGRARDSIDEDFLVNHISGSFVNMVLWWVDNWKRTTPARLNRLFLSVIEPIL